VVQLRLQILRRVDRRMRTLSSARLPTSARRHHTAGPASSPTRHDACVGARVWSACCTWAAAADAETNTRNKPHTPSAVSHLCAEVDGRRWAQHAGAHGRVAHRLLRRRAGRRRPHHLRRRRLRCRLRCRLRRRRRLALDVRQRLETPSTHPHTPATRQLHHQRRTLVLPQPVDGRDPTPTSLNIRGTSASNGAVVVDTPVSNVQTDLSACNQCVSLCLLWEDLFDPRGEAQPCLRPSDRPRWW
jgi:hypothetical protein